MKISKWIIPVTLLGVVACKNDPSDNQERELESGILTQHMDTTVDPGDNFTAYVNGNWMKNTEIPADKSSYGIGTMLHEQAEEDVKKIIEEAASGDFEKGSDEQKVGDLYQSYMDMETRDSLGIKPLEDEFARIDKISSKEELASYFARANRLGLGSPLSLWVNPDFKDPTRYEVFSWQSGLGLPNRDYYVDESDKMNDIRSKYKEHMQRMFTLAGFKNAEARVEKVYQLEETLAKQHMPKEQTRKMEENYNMVAVDSLVDVAPGMAWKTFLSDAGLQGQEKLGVLMMEYVMALDDIVADTELDTWKAYMKWKVLGSAAPYLSQDFVDERFSFYSKELRGVPEQRPMWRRAVSVVNRNLGELVGKVYVGKHFPPEAKQRMEELVDNLLKAYESSIKDLEWMGEETKVEALDKLSKFNPKIGYPDEWKSYDIEISANDLLGNIRKANEMEFQRDLDKLGGPIDKKEWGMTPQTVNAYYNPSLNEIVFPAAILQPPFFDMNAEDAVNYGAIGAVIGHEIGHGFDDSGSTFDGDGSMRNWWTEKDKEEFKKRTNALVAQYDSFEALPGVNVNGTFTLGENIGDLGGLSIALKAYHMSLNGEESPVMDGYSGDQRVLIGWAQAWQGKSRDEALRVQIATDPHSPRDFRVNGVVRNIPEFYSAFNVQPEDSLYLAPEERVKIW